MQSKAGPWRKVALVWGSEGYGAGGAERGGEGEPLLFQVLKCLRKAWEGGWGEPQGPGAPGPVALRDFQRR